MTACGDCYMGIMCARCQGALYATLERERRRDEPAKATPQGHASGEALRAAMAAKASEGQAAAKRRAANEVDGARCALLAMLEAPLSDPTGAPSAVYVARLRERLDDMRAAVDRWAWLHEPCGCGPSEACGKCPPGGEAP